MDLNAKILGQGTIRTLQTKDTAAMLTIGSDRFTRNDLGQVHCWNWKACQLLSEVLARLNVKDTRDLFNRIPPEVLAVPTVASFSIAVLGSVFEIKGIGGKAPLDAWMRKHDATLKGNAQPITFTGLKHRLKRQREETRKQKRKQTA